MNRVVNNIVRWQIEIVCGFYLFIEDFHVIRVRFMYVFCVCRLGREDEKKETDGGDDAYMCRRDL